jgi:BirA family biotin operon repressor/biotin-[acetyl-CoA-carboxylase] ligase
MSQFFDPLDPNILIYDKLDSTSHEAKRIIDSGYADHGMIIWAKEQLHGKGRGEKIWHSCKNNLTFSVLIKLSRNFKNFSLYPFIIALAIKESLEEEQVKNLKFKWPNDILLAGKKIAGILLESKIRMSEENFLICGIGINIETSPQQIVSATNLAAAGYKISDLLKVIFTIIKNIDGYLELIDSRSEHNLIYKKWLEGASNLGKEITIIDGEKKLTGIFKTIKEGNLILECSDKTHIISTGEVFFKDEIIHSADDKSSNITYLNRDK